MVHSVIPPCASAGRWLVSAGSSTRTCSVCPKMVTSYAPGSVLQHFQRAHHRAGGNFQQYPAVILRLQFVRAAQRNELSAINHAQSIAVFGIIHEMRGDEYRDPARGGIVDQLPEFSPRDGVHPRGRLIEE